MQSFLILIAKIDPFFSTDGTKVSNFVGINEGYFILMNCANKGKYRRRLYICAGENGFWFILRSWQYNEMKFFILLHRWILILCFERVFIRKCIWTSLYLISYKKKVIPWTIYFPIPYTAKNVCTENKSKQLK